jgi:hypothetical protein
MEVVDEAPVRNMPGVMYKSYNINTVDALQRSGFSKFSKIQRYARECTKRTVNIHGCGKKTCGLV